MLEENMEYKNKIIMAKSIELDGVRYTKIQLIKRINKIQDSIKNLEELYNKTTKPEELKDGVQVFRPYTK
jgi:predicted  nucleic acid-binding Zn-ribbon protein